MSQPTLEIMTSTSRSWAGMVRVLFQPFDLKKWFLLGFTAWLAQLMQESGSSSSGHVSGDDSSGGNSIRSDGEQLMAWAQDHIGMIIAILSAVLIVGLAITIMLMWVRSRGKFMFLDNLVHDRTLIRQPWAQFKALGNSLFGWSLVLGAIGFFLFVLLGGGGAWLTYVQVQANGWSASSVLGLVGMGLVFFVVMLVLGYIYVLLEDFVVPIMYKHELKATEAWRKFLPIHRQSFWRFILYALWRLVLKMGVSVAVLALGFATCCIGFIPLMIPYISVVLLLPVHVFFRFLGPEFLRQLGLDYDLWSLSEVIGEA